MNRCQEMQYHIAQVPPLVQKIPIDIDTVRFGKVFGDQLADRGEVLFLFGRLVLHIFQLQRIWCCRSWLSHVCRNKDYAPASDAVLVPSVGMKDERMCGALPGLATCLADPWRRSLGRCHAVTWESLRTFYLACDSPPKLVSPPTTK
jgi:hypothetical protein